MRIFKLAYSDIIIIIYWIPVAQSTLPRLASTDFFIEENVLTMTVICGCLT